ncbi:MAG: RsmB/NOP family class I SAM-dependent RNA methyltransferase [Candidatus Nanopelagicales bacterium]
MTDSPRAAALELLRVVREDDAYANLALPSILRQRGLDGRDAGFATELGYGTLRWQGWYDAVLQACVTRPWAKVEPALRDILRLGAHQLLRMRVPDHAAVDSSCALAREAGPRQTAAGRAGFVNAVLRKVAALDEAGWVERLGAGRPADDVEWLAARWSHPAWMVRAFRDALGPRRSELGALLAADNAPARPTLVARPGRLSRADLLALPGTEQARWSPLAATLAHGTPDSLAEVRDGRVGVQDEGSQLVALALAAAPIAGPDLAWLDMCAGPGGKAAILAGLAAERGARLVAVEQHPHRADLVESSLDPAGGATVLIGDARLAPWDGTLFDRVLLDAPCTGLGALRRRPESRWRRTPADLAALGSLQRDLLRAGLAATRPGGVLAYVTCSPHLAETGFVVADVLRGRTDAWLADARGLLPGVDDLGEGPTVQLWPHRHGTDAMYLAVIRREAGPGAQ